MGKLSVFLFALSFCTIVNSGSGSHSLWALATYIIGETPFPECTVVVMLDDVQVTYYDSNMKHFIYRGHNTSDKIHDDEAQDGAYVFGIMYHHMKERYFHLKHHLNLTEGVQVQQRMAGCEMLDNGKPALIMTKNTFNAVFADHAIYYNMTHFTYDAGQLLQGWDGIRQAYQRTVYENFYVPICIRTLKTLLSREKNVVMRKFLPRLKKRHNYTCTASHLSLDNKLDVSWESGAERVHLSTLSVLLVMLLVVILLGIFICVKSRWSNTASQSKLVNVDATVSEKTNLSSDSET